MFVFRSIFPVKSTCCCLFIWSFQALQTWPDDVRSLLAPVAKVHESYLWNCFAKFFLSYLFFPCFHGYDTWKIWWRWSNEKVCDILIVIVLKIPLIVQVPSAPQKPSGAVLVLDGSEKLFKPAAAPNDIRHTHTHLVNTVKRLVAYRPECLPPGFWAAGWETTVFLLVLTLLAPKMVQENYYRCAHLCFLCQWGNVLIRGLDPTVFCQRLF